MLIPPPPSVARETLSVRLDCRILEQLRQYAACRKSTQGYVVEQALKRLFRYDKAFSAWLARHPVAVPVRDADGVIDPRDGLDRAPAAPAARPGAAGSEVGRPGRPPV